MSRVSEIGPPIDASGPRFELGRVFITPGAAKAFDKQTAWSTDGGPGALLRRHVLGDGGDLDEHDRAANARAVVEGSRILSAYRIGPADRPVRIWIITEADRASTTILLPEEY